MTSVFAAAAAFVSGLGGRVMVNARWALDPTIPLALAVLGLVVLVGAATAGWSLVQTHHLGIKPALVHADRPSREPELDDEVAAAQAAARMGRRRGCAWSGSTARFTSWCRAAFTVDVALRAARPRRSAASSTGSTP